MELAALRVIDIQCQVLFSLLNTNVALQPYSLLYLSLCCSHILPVITPEIAAGSSPVLPMIRNIVSGFTNITLPYSRQIMYRTMRAVFVFAKELADKITLVYPSECGTSLIEQLTACDAFADLLKVRKPAVDFFGSDVIIEAINNVRICALKLAYLLVPMLAESKPLLGENLDDVMTSVTRSIETNNPEIMN